MTPLKFVALFHLFLAGSCFLTREQLKETFIDSTANPTHEIDPTKLCQEYSLFVASEEGQLIKPALAELHSPEKNKLYTHYDSSSRKIYEVQFKDAPAAVKLVSRAKFETKIRSELYYWIKTFVSFPEDVLEFKFCVYDKSYFYLVTEDMVEDMGDFSDNFRLNFSRKRQLGLLRRLVEILSHVQSLGIAHQEIFPGSFLIQYRYPAQQYKIKISGFLKAAEAGKQNPLAGRLMYAPPESLQIKDSYSSSSGDIWGMGITFLKLATNDSMVYVGCYDEFTLECYDLLQDLVFHNFNYEYGFKGRTSTKLSEAENIMEVTASMLTYSPSGRPSAADVIKQLEHLESITEII